MREARTLAPGLETMLLALWLAAGGALAAGIAVYAALAAGLSTGSLHWELLAANPPALGALRWPLLGAALWAVVAPLALWRLEQYRNPAKLAVLGTRDT